MKGKHQIAMKTKAGRTWSTTPTETKPRGQVLSTVTSLLCISDSLALCNQFPYLSVGFRRRFFFFFWLLTLWHKQCWWCWLSET